MRQTLTTILTSLCAGILGAGAVWWFGFRRDAPADPGVQPQQQVAARAEAPAAIVPPGWDPRFLSRLSAVESRVAGLAQAASSDAGKASAAAANGASPTVEQMIAEKEQGRAEHYRQELDHLANELAEHDAEVLDSSFRSEEEPALEGALSKANPGNAFHVNRVDCRSKTCVASLTFPTPDDALERLGSLARTPAPGCHGLAIIPEPPTSAGPYLTRIVYYCR